LFTVRSGRRGGPRTGYLRAVVAAVVVALLALATAGLLGAGPVRSIAVAVFLGGSTLAWAPVAKEWAARGLVAWALSRRGGALPDLSRGVDVGRRPDRGRAVGWLAAVAP